MIHFKHLGIYVNDINKLSSFYKTCFDMTPICENQRCSGELFKQLFGTEAEVLVTKLITNRGKDTGIGDMLELIEPVTKKVTREERQRVFEEGVAHISLGISNIDEVVQSVIENGGSKQTDILDMGNGNKCCFCTDPEGNWIELIQNGSK